MAALREKGTVDDNNRAGHSRTRLKAKCDPAAGSRQTRTASPGPRRCSGTERRPALFKSRHHSISRRCRQAVIPAPNASLYMPELMVTPTAPAAQNGRFSRDPADGAGSKLGGN